ncbi:MAG: sialidase family protein, partial [Planctomycetota bacterium]|nr:sialidase family protein [Planctomycetota bacterium]
MNRRIIATPVLMLTVISSFVAGASGILTTMNQAVAEDVARTAANFWRDHIVRRLGGTGEDVRVPAKMQIVTESWNRVVAVPYIVYLPEKDRVLMLVGCDYPHHPMLLHSDDRGATWSEPKNVGLNDDGNIISALGTGLTCLGGGSVIFYGTTRWVSHDSGETWSELSPIAHVDGRAWAIWDPPLVDRDTRTGKLLRILETGYTGSTDGGQQAYLRESTDEGETFGQATQVPQWKKVSEVALIRAKNGDLVAACRTDMPERMHGDIDHSEGLGVSISEDNGKTWSEVKKLYDFGRHHPSMVLLPNGDLVMTYVVRKGYIDSPDGFRQFGIEAVVSKDHGRTWDLDH